MKTAVISCGSPRNSYLLKDYFNHDGALARQEKRIRRCEKGQHLGLKLASISSFQDYSFLQNFFTFKLVLHQCPTNFQQVSKQITSLKIMCDNLETSFF